MNKEFLIVWACVILVIALLVSFVWAFIKFVPPMIGLIICCAGLFLIMTGVIAYSLYNNMGN